MLKKLIFTNHLCGHYMSQIRSSHCHFAISLVVAFFFVTSHGSAQDVSTHQHQAKLIKAPEANLPSGIELFGDTVNLYNGGLGIAHVDVSLPGNGNLPVSVGRRLSLGSTIPSGRQFGRWELDIPYIHTTTSTVDGWVTRDGDQLRCTKFGAPRRANTGVSQWNAVEFWPGNNLYVPGVGEQRMLARAAGNTRAPGGNTAAYPVVTSERWAFSCIALASGGAGEGFIAVAPDGTRYRFDRMVSYAATGLSKHISAPMGYLPETATEPVTSTIGYPSEYIGASNFFLPRKQYALLPSVVTDRFGNTVSYTYDPAKPSNLTKIQASDGRTISLTYGNGDQSHLIQTVTDGTRTWNYSYYNSHSGLDLDRVTQPDQSSWQLGGLKDMFTDVQVNEYSTCSVPLSYIPHVLEGEMVHPSGATARYRMEPIAHGRSQVPKARCGDYVYILQTPRLFYAHSLLSKVITGPGLPSMTWLYDYGVSRNSYVGCTTCVNTKTVSVTEPEGTVNLHTFGNHFGVNEGKLLQVDYGWNGSTALRTVLTQYRPFNAGPYLPEEGVTERYMGDAGTNLKTMPQEQRVTTQQGVTLTWKVEVFDDWARPLTINRFNSLQNSRVETTSYEDNMPLWVLGQVKQITEGSTGKVKVSNTYFPTTAQLETVSHFGRIQKRMTYHADGTLATEEDGKLQKTTFNNYKRGIAQNIVYADNSTQNASVNNIGKLDSITDANGYVTSYAYNPIGILAKVTPPANDSVAWNPTLISFEQILGWEYDLSPGHWRQVSTTGAASTVTYYDGLWRPSIVHTADLNSPNSTSALVRKQYDSAGNITFTSYPKRTFAELGAGVSQEFDVLDRRTVTTSSSELGPITSTSSYDNGFITTQINGRGVATTTRYLVYDDPTSQVVSSVSAPEGVEFTIGRDIFDKPKTITRSGNGKIATRTYVYDNHERLCKAVEPEVGATIQAYDAANNIAWKASGLPLPSTTNCDYESVSASNKVVMGYNPVNQIVSTTFGDGSPSIQKTYTPDGLVESVGSGGTQWTYGYNKRRFNESETLSYAGTNYSLVRSFDSNGSIASLMYPDQTVVAYNPNALGQEQQVGVYASGIQYHPNGAVAAFTYGNGIARTLSQNPRGLPQRAFESGVMNDVYAYDQNSNVTSILDEFENYSNRSMEYDGLDRLTKTTAPSMWGDAIYGYDALDNITSTSIASGLTARQTIFHYSSPALNRLDAITGSAGYNLNYQYDNQGNITKRGSQYFTFDLANRMKEAVGKATYVYDGWNRRVSTVGTDGLNRISLYSQAGQILFSGPIGGAKTKNIYLNNHLLAEVNNSLGTVFSHNDALGSPMAKTNSAGTLLSRTRYEPFGLTSWGATPTVGFTGHVNDSDTGLVYMQQRYYDPIAGRMMSIDPVSADANTGGNFNRYAYANNSPYKFVDPDGRLPFLVPLIFVAKELVGEAFEQTTGIPAPTLKNLGKGAVKIGLKQIAERGAKRGPKPEGVGLHNQKIRETADKIVEAGGEIIAGGGRGKREVLIPTPGGAKQGRRPDIIYKDKDGVEGGVNVGKVKADGVTPVPREIEALNDLNGPGKLPTTFIPYN